MKCTECNYFWTDEGERYGRCHWTDWNGADSLHGTPWDIAPCEEEEYEEPEYDEFEERW